MQVGDVIYLRSGSPKLTVKSIGSSFPAYITVTWVGCISETIETATFPEPCLTYDEPRDVEPASAA